MRVWPLQIFLAVALISAGCQKASPAPPIIVPTGPTAAQPKLKTIRLFLGPEEMIAEMALTEQQERTGMMFRTNMDDNCGMLFVFPEPYRAGFWMQNCPLPLSAAYIGPDGTILDIHDLKPQDTNTVLANTDNVQFVIEANKDWFARKHIAVGTSVRTQYGGLKETFLNK